MADSPDLPSLPSDPASPETAPNPGATASSAAGLNSPKPRTPPDLPAQSWLSALGTLGVRLMVLGLGITGGWLAGVLVAQVLPARNPEPPTVEVALRASSQTARKLRQLPRWWQGRDTVGLAPGVTTPVLEPSLPAPAEQIPTPDAPGSELPSLTEGDRDRLQADLSRLRQDLANLNTRLQALETTLGEAPTGSLENRLQRLDQRLAPVSTNAGQTSETAGSKPPAAGPAAIANPVPLVPYPEPHFPLVSDRIILPTALLFEPGSSTLTASGQQLLDSIAADLHRYGPVTLLVGSHTDPTIATDLASQLTLQQALAVQQHLAPQLEGEGARWVALGYGYTRPRTTGITPTDRQRNQRVEIGVVPGS